MEPRAATPERRLDTLRLLSEAGIPTTVMVAPVIPALNESEIERILEAAAAAGVREAGYVLLRLPLEVRDIFKEFLEREYPDRAKHVMSVIRSMRGGKDYDPTGASACAATAPMPGRSAGASRWRRGASASTASKLRLRTDLFVPPRPETDQLDLFAGRAAA